MLPDAAVHCTIMEYGDEAETLEASLIENSARLDPDELVQFAAFNRLAEKGQSFMLAVGWRE